jgi:hypothetical protein
MCCMVLDGSFVNGVDPADLLINQAVLNQMVHGHTSREVPNRLGNPSSRVGLYAALCM